MLDVSASAKIQETLNHFDQALASQDVDRVLALFDDECYWRDFLTFTWNLKTLEGKSQIRGMLTACLARAKPGDWTVEAEELAQTAEGVTQGFIRFGTAEAVGRGYIKLRNGKIWVLLTTMVDLKGFEEPIGRSRPFGARHNENLGDAAWIECRQKEQAEIGVTTQPYVLIIGGAQAGIVLGARLRQLNVPALIVERHEQPGDNWRSRYKSLCLHDPVWYDHLPYVKFPPNWPVFSPKDKIAEWLDMYAKVMDLNYWGGAEATHASYDEASESWTVTVNRRGQELVLHPKQLVLATGMSGKPRKPRFPGQDRFQGIQQHSSEHPGPDGMQGKRVVVIGSNNSAHDICGALAEAGVDVTMVQRSSTHVSRSASLMKYALGPLYSEDAVAAGIDTDRADLLFASIPYRLMTQSLSASTDTIKKVDADFYRGLQDRGFMLNDGPDNGGLFSLYLFRASGYYIDIGASQRIIDGEIKLASGSEVKGLTEHSVLLQDGRELPADVVIYATGYQSMNSFAADIISPAVADKVGKCWGVGSDTAKDPGPWEGEQRNMWKPTHQQALWFQGGNLAQSRFYSRYLALQLKARLEGLPTPVYGLQEVHHTC